MLIRHKDRIFNTAAISIAIKEPAIPHAVPAVTVKFVDGTEEIFAGDDSSKVWALLCAAADNPAS